MLLSYKNHTPLLDDSVYVAEGAKIIGNVTIGSGSSVWFNTVIRGDVHYVKIGAKTNIQDLSMIHVASGKFPTIIGDEVTVGHQALIHACQIGDRCLIGMGSIIMDGCRIGDDCLIAAGSLLPERMDIPSGSVAMGRPAKIVRTLKDTEKDWIKLSAQNYYRLSREYLGVFENLP